jgi:hypothetical protein
MWQNFKEGLQKSQHAYEEGNREAGMKQGFGQLKITACIGNTRNWLVWHVLTNPISQPSLDISPI